MIKVNLSPALSENKVIAYANSGSRANAMTLETPNV
jgi:phosphoheptose isomerase